MKNKTYFVFPTTSNPKFPTIFWPKTKTTPGLSSRFLQLQGESRGLCHRCCDFQSGSQGRERFGAKGIHIPYGHGQVLIQCTLDSITSRQLGVQSHMHWWAIGIVLHLSWLVVGLASLCRTLLFLSTVIVQESFVV